MDPVKQKQNARHFVERWKKEKGNEEEQSRSFWIEFAQDILGIENPTHVLEFERKVKGRKIDVFYEDMGVLIEQKSRGVDLDKKSERSKKAGEETPYQQAKWYADNLPYSVRPRWIIVSNFDEFRIHDLDTNNPENEYVNITLDELPENIHLFSFFTDRSASRLVKEKELSVQAGEIVGRLYKSLAAQYKNIDTDKQEQRSLNILIVRFVFLLYAEDAGILQEHQAFLEYMKGIEPEQFRTTLKELFKVLDTPEDKRDPYLDPELAAFPYINGSLFSEQNIVIPQFTTQIKYDLLKEASQEFDWSGISPTIFGAVFESTLNPDTRREGGMHYTSIENIHKVIDPLFLDDLTNELTSIEGEKIEKRRNLLLRQFQNKLASIKILDPACGSGNFLTESYLNLRKLENRVLENLMGEQMGMGFDGEANPIKVSIDQFFGIEINDFAVAVAKTALWIAEEQMMDKTQEILLMPLDFLPLTSNNNIHEGNALRMDWDEVIPSSKCSYIIGNPPFYGYSYQNESQKEDIAIVFKETKVSKKIDYVSCWYQKSIHYINNKTRCALVSTNSITQGEQVPDLWKTLLEEKLVIDFAWTAFVWDNEASDKAHVHVVIIGFHKGARSKSTTLFSENKTLECDNINPYLIDAPIVFIESRSKPICNVEPINKGSQPTDGGNLIIKTSEELNQILQQEPNLNPYIKRYMGSEEMINNKYRWVFWLKDAPKEIIQNSSILQQRLDAVAKMRSESTKASTREAASKPYLFTEIRQPETDYLMIPSVSSERRFYIPIAFVDSNVIASNLSLVIPNASLYMFGILTSQFHNAWMRTVAGRLESRYRYSNKIVYNNFIWPNPTDEQKQKIETLAQAILDIRDSYPNLTLADLYDPEKMPADLLAAHKALDKAVEEAYGVDFDGDEEKIVAHLFKLYADKTKTE